MSHTALIADRTLVEGEEVHDVVVVIDGTQVVEVASSVPPGAITVRLPGCDLIPGLVDLHSDCLDETMHPRPSADLPMDAALLELDAELLAHGITTHYLCIAIETATGSKRSAVRALETLATLGQMRPFLRADHRVHLRVDVAGDDIEACDRAHDIGPIDLVSYMDHTPGQGQYPDIDRWKAAYSALAGPDAPGPDAILAAKEAHAGQREGNRLRVAAIARARGTRLASHDDDSPDRVAQAVACGVSISEFPVTADAVKAAGAAGLGVVMGAPNARRGRSHSGNLSVADVVAEGHLDALASDYHPPSMLVAAHTLVDLGQRSWAEALGLVSTGPARIVGHDDRGRIASGLRADLVAVRPLRPSAGEGAIPITRPVVAQTWVAGRAAFPGGHS